ncbi:MAG TPA: YHS domain-containing protein [Rhodocyclaceae bacterium]|jgi:YHS domain-containing protein
MKTQVSTSRDPVCGMDIPVNETHPSTTYRGLVFHFCSNQCLERFEGSPELYTGGQRTADIHPMPKQRRLRVVSTDAAALDRACQKIREMMGITSVVAEKGDLLLEYDLRQATLVQIERVAAAEGVVFKGGLHGFRRSLWKFKESNEVSNAALAGTGACCNHPPARTK